MVKIALPSRGWRGRAILCVLALSASTAEYSSTDLNLTSLLLRNTQLEAELAALRAHVAAESALLDDAPGCSAMLASTTSTTATTPPPTPALPPPRAAWQLRGVAALGARGLRVPHGSLPAGAREGGSWSISLWLWLKDGASASPRALFFRGPRGGDQRRTPSAWVDAGAPRVLLRCSTAASSDIGGTTVGELPVRRWTHIAFVFANLSTAVEAATTAAATNIMETDPASSSSSSAASTAAAAGVATFSYSMYVDGALDSEVTFRTPLVVLANGGALHVGAIEGGGGEGVEALLGRLRLFQGALAPAQVAADFAAGRAVYAPERLAAAGDVATWTASDASPEEALAVRGVAAAAALAAAWASPRHALLEELNGGSSSRRTSGCPRPCESDAEDEAWAAALEAAGVEFDPLLRVFVPRGEGGDDREGGGGGGGGESGEGSGAAGALALIEDSGGSGNSSADAGAPNAAATNALAAAEEAFFAAMAVMGDCGAGPAALAGAVRLLEAAAAARHPAATRELAAARELPLRDECAGELRRAWPASAAAAVAARGAPRARDLTRANLLEALGAVAHSARALLWPGGASVAGVSGGASAGAGADEGAGAGAAGMVPRGIFARDEAASRRLRARAAALGDASAVYELGLDALTRSAPGAAAPSAADAAFGLGLAHLAAAAGEEEAHMLLAVHYARGEGGVGSPAAASFAAPGAGAGSPGAVAAAGGSARLRAGVRAATLRLLQLRAQGGDVGGEEEKGENGGVSEASANGRGSGSGSDSDNGSGGDGGGGSSGDEASRARAVVARFFAAHSPGYLRDEELACFYFEAAADAAEALQHSPAGRPLHEMQRLTIDAADSGEVEVLQKGLDEEQLLLQRARCEEHGDAAACEGLASLHSWGARGVPRDLPRAFALYGLAARAGHLGARLSAAQMLLQGQGVARDAPRAVAMYEEALAGAGGAERAVRVRALNGLGLAYFHGAADGLDPARALAYFERAAALGDADALFNAGHCLLQGLGAPRNASAAAAHFRAGAAQGHFASMLAAGRMLARGGMPRAAGAGSGAEAAEAAAEAEAEALAEAGARNAAGALPLLAAVADCGPWAGLVRRGFERYLARDFGGALLRYRRAAALGLEVGAANAAYLLHRGLAAPVRLAGAGARAEGDRQRLAFLLFRGAHARAAGADTALALAGFHVSGAGGARRDALAAAALYARASEAGSPEAAFGLAALLEQGAADGSFSPSAARAELFYRRALALAPGPAARLVAQLALRRLALLRWLRERGLAPEQLQALAEHFFGAAPPAEIDEGATAAAAAPAPAAPRGLSRAAAGSVAVRLFAAALGDVAVNAGHEGRGGVGAAELAAKVAVALLAIVAAELLRQRCARAIE
jgi:TPR repeat protein